LSLLIFFKKSVKRIIVNISGDYFKDY